MNNYERLTKMMRDQIEHPETGSNEIVNKVLEEETERKAEQTIARQTPRKAAVDGNGPPAQPPKNWLR